jgi:mRNA-degrading endonuclease toxin of MazEF toxin-antitoxin module
MKRGELYLVRKPGSRDPRKQRVTADGLKKESSIRCDDLVSLPKSVLTSYVGSLKANTVARLDMALSVALGLA